MDLFYIRFRQILFLIRNLHAYFAFIVLLAGSVIYYLMTPANKQFALWGSLFYLSYAISKHLKRKDLTLVKRNFSYPSLQLWGELIFFCTPALFLLFYHSNTTLLLISLIVLSLAANIRIKHDLSNRFDCTINEKTFFKIIGSCQEWICLSRRYRFILVALIVLSMALCWIQFLPLFFLYCIFILLSDIIIRKNESLTLLRASLLYPNRFLIEKSKQLLWPWTIISLPVCLAGGIIHYQFWYIYLLIFIYSLILLCFCLFLKYAEYYPRRQSYNIVIYTMITISPVIPILIPVNIVLCFLFYFQALQNLKKYLC